MSLNFGDSKQR